MPLGGKGLLSLGMHIKWASLNPMRPLMKRWDLTRWDVVLEGMQSNNCSLWCPMHAHCRPKANHAWMKHEHRNVDMRWSDCMVYQAMFASPVWWPSMPSHVMSPSFHVIVRWSWVIDDVDMQWKLLWRKLEIGNEQIVTGGLNKADG